MTAPSTLRRRIKSWLHAMPGMISCSEFESFILDYFEGDLPATQRRVFERHLRFCRECRDYLAAYKATLALEKRVLADDGALDMEVPEDLIAAVIAARNENSGE